MLNSLLTQLHDFVPKSPLNYIDKDLAIQDIYAGQRLFEEPIYAVSSAQDPLFLNLKNKVIGEHFRLPTEWLPTAKSVISFFLPFTDAIIKSNKEVGDPSHLWLHGRIEGQEFVKAMAFSIVDFFEKQGYKSLYPVSTKDFFAVRDDARLGFSSNWSERHVAFICGLGTFGLSKGIITKKGMAGRLCSVVTEAKLPLSTRYYTEIYENCSMCGACIPRCPVDAICLEEGKKHLPCYHFSLYVKKKYTPRHGCGKCQCFVPCTKQIPKKKQKPELFTNTHH